ncbi:hypothetical protein SANA_31260 [Gottschalkiaceae bacterium SANA]|nr:hypothetical protein SANA_31260 [Gottschalkiaceae bacterium SANA]
MKIKQKRKICGFTLIELILVLALLTSMGALAAPQVISVFDHSKEDLEQLQMTQVLLAYQQADIQGDLASDQADAEGKFVNFLKSEKQNPIYLSGIDTPCCVTGTGQLSDNYRAVQDGDRLFIECKECGLRSDDSINLSRDDSEIVDYTYLDEVNFEQGTWLIIGDDENLRQDYFKKLKIDAERNYKMETNFIIVDGDGEMGDEAQNQAKEEWLYFTTSWAHGVKKFWVNDRAPWDIYVKLSARKKGNQTWDDLGWLNSWEEVNVAKYDQLRAEFYRNKTELIGALKYSIYHTGHGANGEIAIDSIDPDWQGESSGGRFYTGQVFNYFGEPGTAQYDFFAFEMKKNGRVKLSLYHVNEDAGTTQKIKEDIKEWDFLDFYNREHQMIVEMKSDRVSLWIDGDELVDKLKLQNSLPAGKAPSIGYYMGNPVEGSAVPNRFALDQYPTPYYMRLLDMPSVNGGSVVEKPQAPTIIRLGTEHITTQPIPFQVETKAEESFLLHLDYPRRNDHGVIERVQEESTQRKKNFAVNAPGEIIAYVTVDGRDSDKVTTKVDNIIEPFDELNGSAKVEWRKTVFRFANLQNGMEENYWRIVQEIELVQQSVADKGYDDQIWIEIKDNTNQPYKIEHLNYNNEFVVDRRMDLNTIQLYVTTNYDEILNPIAYIVRPDPPEGIVFNSYWGDAYFEIEGTGNSRDQYEYRWLNESGAVLKDWEAYPDRNLGYGIELDETVFSVEARTIRNEIFSQSITKENPYYEPENPNGLEAPEIAVGDGYSIEIQSIQDTTIEYSIDNGSWTDSKRQRLEITLEAEQTIEVRAKDRFTDRRSQVKSYTAPAPVPEKPQAPTITEYFNGVPRIKVTRNADEGALVITRYWYNKGRLKSDTLTKNKSTVRFKMNMYMKVEAYVVINGQQSDTTVWDY